MKWHGLDPQQYSYFSIQNLFESDSWSFDYLDIKQGTGSNSEGFVEVDLNNSIPSHLYSNYDLLIDSGTAEHCFNIGKVFENYFHLLKPSGILLQFMPFLSPNHGFWSINPTAIYDLASCNPIKVFDCKVLEYASYKDYFSGPSRQVPFPSVQRFNLDCDVNSIYLLFLPTKA